MCHQARGWGKCGGMSSGIQQGLNMERQEWKSRKKIKGKIRLTRSRVCEWLE
jgi:hypothetical protein